MASQIVTILYSEDKGTAHLDCPLCNRTWRFPFQIHRISGKLNQLPSAIFSRHLYGADGDTGCPMFDISKNFELKDMSENTVELSY
jgi:hypothetical protein